MTRFFLARLAFTCAGVSLANWTGIGLLKAQTAPRPFSIVVISDPQYPRAAVQTTCSPSCWGEKNPAPAESEAAIRATVSLINNVIGTSGQAPVKGVILNGDLTEYGHGNELDKLKQIFGPLSVPRYYGLGNHDYQNNIDDSFENRNPTTMIEFVRDEMRRQLPGLNMDIRERAEAGKYFIEGSFAYSWDIEHVHFVQLHNFPLYEQRWGSYRSDRVAWVDVTVKNALAWLRQDLAAARARGQAIILNMHEPTSQWDSNESWDGRLNSYMREKAERAAKGEPPPPPPAQPKPENLAVITVAAANRSQNLATFNNLVDTYKVSAIFGGHYHRSFGRDNLRATAPASRPPVYLAGGAIWGSLLVLEFDAANNMKVSGRVHNLSPAPPPQHAPFSPENVTLDRSVAGGSCEARTWRVQSDHSWAEFRMPKSIVGFKHTIPAGAHNNYVYARCNRVWWEALQFTCLSNGTWISSGRADADGLCGGSPTADGPYLGWGNR